MCRWSAVGERKLEIAAPRSTSDTDNSGNYTRENTQGNFNKQVINKFDGFTCLAGERAAVFTSSPVQVKLKLKCWPEMKFRITNRPLDMPAFVRCVVIAMTDINLSTTLYACSPLLTEVSGVSALQSENYWVRFSADKLALLFVICRLFMTVKYLRTWNEAK